MTKKIVKWVGNIVIFCLLALCVTSLYSIIQAKNNPGQIPGIFGYKIMTVLTGSMEPVLEPGDMIVVKTIDPNKAKMNDVITYKNAQNTLVTHRIVDITLNDGELFFETKGDANNVKDQDLVSSEQLVGSLSYHIPKAGYIADFFKSPTGLTVLLLIPFLYLTIGVLRKVFADNENQDGDVKV